MDKGHTDLMIDLEEIFLEAATFEFHDFKNAKYFLPKKELVQKLDRLKANVISGKYNN